MKFEQLDSIINEKVNKQIEEAKATIKSEMGNIANITDENKFNEAVSKAVSKIMEDNKKSLNENAEMLLNFEKANAENEIKGLKHETPVTVVNEMIGSALKAMADKNATNVKQVSSEEILASAKKYYPNSKALHAVLGQKTLTASVPADGGFTVPLAFSGDYIKALYANTILEKLGVRKAPMPNGNLSVPKMTASASAYWIGEANAITSSQATFGEVNLKAKKLACLSPVSNDLLRYNAVGIDAWIAEDLMMKAKIALDDAFLHGTGTANAPLGLENVTGVQSFDTTGHNVEVTTPIDMVALLEQANIPMENVKWLLNPLGKSWLQGKAFASGPFAWADEIARSKTLNGYDFVTSSTVKYDSGSGKANFWVGDFSQFLWGVGYDISVEMSREGSFADGNGNTISAFQNDLTLVRLITEHDFACRNANSFVKANLSKA